MAELVKKTWLENPSGTKISPNTFVDQLYNNDGTPFEMPEGVEVVDNLTTDDPDQALSARQGKALNDSKLNITSEITADEVNDIWNSV